tara:strand:+ start:36 stop:614 length:579 start_codon:yes stop_codon:yes gene_type:complete
MQENYQTHLPPQQLQLENITTLESESTQKQKQETTGHKCTKCGVDLVPHENWTSGAVAKGYFICRFCRNNDEIDRVNSLSDAKLLHMYAKKRAKAKCRDFTITVEDIEKVDAAICPILEIPMKRYKQQYEGGAGYQMPDSKTLDRIDPSKGYTPDNIRVISWAANKMLGNWDLVVLLKGVTNAIALKYATVH